METSSEGNTQRSKERTAGEGRVRTVAHVSPQRTRGRHGGGGLGGGGGGLGGGRGGLGGRSPSGPAVWSSAKIKGGLPSRASPSPPLVTCHSPPGPDFDVGSRVTRTPWHRLRRCGHGQPAVPVRPCPSLASIFHVMILFLQQRVEKLGLFSARTPRT